MYFAKDAPIEAKPIYIRADVAKELPNADDRRMNDPVDSQEMVFQSYRRDECMELGLVLTSAEIANQISHHSGKWWLSVEAKDEASALQELAAYRRDNPVGENVIKRRIPLFGGSFAGAFIYAATICLIGSVSSSEATRDIWMSTGQMNSDMFLQGQVWRATTALTLHADAQHLMSNLAFGCVFGMMAGRILGGGIAWLSIVGAGTLGNGLNAIMRSESHLSIGASTAVFAALGVMVAHALHPRFVSSEKRFKRWSPLIAGVLLLAFVGVGGERTDVGAHVTGFVSGMVIGWLAARLPLHWLSNSRLQMASGFIAFAMVVLAWTFAVRFGAR